MARFQTLGDIDVGGRRVLLRADLNVPLKNGVVTDATRIERLAPTIEALIEKGAKVIVMSHFGRPQGRPDPAYSLRPLVAPLSKAIGGRGVASARLRPLSKLRRGRFWRSLAGLRCRPSLISCGLSLARWISWRSAARWPTPCCPPREPRSAARCASAIWRITRVGFSILHASVTAA